MEMAVKIKYDWVLLVAEECIDNQNNSAWYKRCYTKIWGEPKL